MRKYGPYGKQGINPYLSHPVTYSNNNNNKTTTTTDMGCVNSGVTINTQEEDELGYYITKHDIRLVQVSWRIIRQDIDTVGMAIFKRFFAQSREVKKLFASRLRKAEDVYDEYGDLQFDMRKVQDHARIVMEALGSAVECLTDSKELTTILIGIGERHVMYGIHPYMVPLLWPPIITSFEEHLGPKFTPQIGKAWENVFAYISNTVIGGMRRWKRDKDDNETPDTGLE